MSLRLAEVSDWLVSLFPTAEINSLKYIESDASARKYLRCKLDGEPYIVMDTVPGQEQINFVKIAQILTDNKINAPKIIHNDLQRGLILMNDFGDQTYLMVLKQADAAKIDQLYLDAIYSIINMQSIAKDYDLPVMDAAYIANRLDVFKTWYLQKHLQVTVDDKAEALLSELMQMFSKVFTEFSPVFVHVDYHCRNLMHVPTANNPGIIDFQDAMYGPMTYDLVSLFQDAYITWPRSQVEAWLKTYYDLAVAAGLLADQNFASVLRNFDLVGLQRHLKNLGVFARLHHRDNKSGYLKDIPTLLSYITETCWRYPELSSLQQYLNVHILELC